MKANKVLRCFTYNLPLVWCRKMKTPCVGGFIGDKIKVQMQHVRGLKEITAKCDIFMI